MGWTTAPLAPKAPQLPAEQADKERFAAALLRYPNNAYQAAVSAFGMSGQAFKASVEWLNDAYVLERKEALLKEYGAEHFLPGKAEFAHLILDAIEEKMSNGILRYDLKDRVPAMKLYAEIMGFMPKSGGDVNVNVTNNRVMVVQDHGTDDDWERKCREHQAKLIDASAAA